MNKKKITTKHPLPKQKATVVKKDTQRSYRWLFELLGILALVFITYGNSIKNDYNLDDGYVVSLDKSNTLTEKGIRGIPEIMAKNYNEGLGVTYGYRPLGKISMAIEYSLWQNNPHYSHFINLLLYALNVFLLLIFFTKLGEMLGYKNRIAIYAGIMLFILHPLHTEVVCSIKNREELLCFSFMLTALIFYFKISEEKKWIYFLPFSICVILSYLSKESAVNIIGILLLIFFIQSYQLRKFSFSFILFLRERITYKSILYVLPIIIIYIAAEDKIDFFVISISVYTFLILIRSITGSTLQKAVKRHYIIVRLIMSLSVIFFVLLGIQTHEVTSKADIITSFDQNPYHFLLSGPSLLLGLNTFLFYLKRLIIPYPLLYYYGYNMLPLKSWNTVVPYAGIFLLLLFTGFAFYSFKKKQHTFLAFSILFFLGTLLPFCNFFSGYFITGIVGERLCFQASAGFCMMVSLLVFWLPNTIKNNKTPLAAAYFFTGIIAVIFLFITVNRNGNWKDRTTLFEHDIPFLSQSARANFLLASRYMIDVNSNPYLPPADKMQMVDKARSLLHTALKVYPAYGDAWTGLGMIHYQFFSNRDSAFICFSKVDTANRFIYARARELLGDISYNDMKDKERAKTFYLQAYRHMPESNTLYGKITRILFETAQYDSILVFSENGIRNNLPEAYVDKADAYVNLGDTSAAIPYYQKAYSKGFNRPLMPKIEEFLRRNNNHI